MSKGNWLYETMEFRATQLVEGNERSGGKLIARGEFARADVATENKRVYPLALWERELGRIGKQLSDRKVYGELDHPMDGRTSLKRVSHLLTGLRMENGVVVGEAEILDTAEGRNLKAILAAGGKVGVSSRGFGTTRPNLKGEDVVNDDYRLMTFDFVAEPANVTSYPEVRQESKKTDSDSPMSESVEKMKFDELKKANPSLYEHFMDDAEREYEKRGAKLWAEKIMAAREQAQTDLRGEFGEKLETALSQISTDLADQIRGEIMSDPSVAGAKYALEQVKGILTPFILPGDAETVVKTKDSEIQALKNKLAESELKNKTLGEQVDSLVGVAKEAGYKWHVERRLSGAPHADQIRKLVGDVRQYESSEQIDEKITSIVEEFESIAQKHKSHDDEMARLKEENVKLREATELALEATQAVALESYIDRRLANHPKADRVRSLIESRNPQTKESVDSLIEGYRPKRQDPEDLSQARARVRALTRSGTSEYVEEEVQHRQSSRQRPESRYNDIPGVNLQDIRALSGMEDKK